MNKTLAKSFDEIASPLLSTLGFRLINDPMETCGFFKLSQAVYSSIRGLFLEALFNPNEGNSAHVMFGRRWSVGERTLCISNTLSALTGRYGVDFPEYYEFSSFGDAGNLIDAMLADLKATLPIVLERVTLADLEFIESEATGAQQIAKSKLGPGYIFDVEISDFVPQLYTGSSSNI